MYIIGITGGVGAGKSEILNYVKEHYGAKVVKADDIGHLGMQKGEECYLPIIDLLGDDIINDDGAINRSKVAMVVHADKEKIDKLNAIIHPYVKECIVKLAIDAQADGRKYFFIEAALLFEANYDQMCDEVWYIYANCDVRCARLAKSRNYDEEKSRQIMDNQLSEEEFKSKCDYIIDNSGDFADTIKQIDERMQKYETM